MTTSQSTHGEFMVGLAADGVLAVSLPDGATLYIDTSDKCEVHFTVYAESQTTLMNIGIDRPYPDGLDGNPIP